MPRRAFTPPSFVALPQLQLLTTRLRPAWHSSPTGISESMITYLRRHPAHAQLPSYLFGMREESGSPPEYRRWKATTSKAGPYVDERRGLCTRSWARIDVCFACAPGQAGFAAPAKAFERQVPSRTLSSMANLAHYQADLEAYTYGKDPLVMQSYTPRIIAKLIAGIPE